MRVRPNSAARRPLRRRFTLVAVGLLSVLMAVLGVQFAGDTGTATATITQNDGIILTTPPAAGASVQGWAVSVGSAGTVPAPTAVDEDGVAGGDTAVRHIVKIDATEATSTKMLVTVYVTNLSELAANYSSWNFNIGVWTSKTGTAAGDQQGEQVMTSDSGAVSFIVPVDTTDIHWVRLNGGGSFYTIAANTGSGASLSPEFFVRATQL